MPSEIFNMFFLFMIRVSFSSKCKRLQNKMQQKCKRLQIFLFKSKLKGYALRICSHKFYSFCYFYLS